MRWLAKLAAVLLCAAFLPSAAYAQASITGVVRDTSGGVLPGVTVEAASPVLIEKVRTVVTDGNGRYQIVDLRPGAYTVTFTLAGFNTGDRVRRSREPARRASREGAPIRGNEVGCERGRIQRHEQQPCAGRESGVGPVVAQAADDSQPPVRPVQCPVRFLIGEGTR